MSAFPISNQAGNENGGCCCRPGMEHSGKAFFGCGACEDSLAPQVVRVEISDLGGASANELLFVGTHYLPWAPDAVLKQGCTWEKILNPGAMFPNGIRFWEVNGNPWFVRCYINGFNGITVAQWQPPTSQNNFSCRTGGTNWSPAAGFYGIHLDGVFPVP